MPSLVDNVQQIVGAFFQGYLLALKHGECVCGPREVVARDGLERKRRGDALQDVRLKLSHIALYRCCKRIPLLGPDCLAPP